MKSLISELNGSLPESVDLDDSNDLDAAELAALAGTP